MDGRQADLIPALFLSDWHNSGNAAVILPMLFFFLWNRQLFRGEAKVPRRSYGLLPILAMLTVHRFRCELEMGLTVPRPKAYGCGLFRQHRLARFPWRRISLFLRNSGDKELYSSRSKLMQVKIAHHPAMIAAPTGCSFGELFFNTHSPGIQRVSHVPVSDHSTAALTSCSPIHFVRHLKPRRPEGQAR
jgi:hypothetical protein